MDLNGICDTIEQFGKQSYSASKKTITKNDYSRFYARKSLFIERRY